jgi:opacity protein-like surface antigen
MKNKTQNHMARLASVATAATMVMAAGQATAQDYQNSVTLYGLIPWIDTEVTGSGGNSAESSATPGDIIDALDFTVMLAGESRFGKFSFLYDALYTDLSEKGTLGGPFAGAAKVDVEMLLATAALGYALHEGNGTLLQGYGGVRLVDVSTDVRLAGGGPVGAGFDARVDETWFDPMIGLRGRMTLSEKVSLGGFASIGGFGVGSDLSFDIFGGVEYAFSERFSANAGFRYMSFDYGGGNADFDLEMYGPVFGITMRF